MAIKLSLTIVIIFSILKLIQADGDGEHHHRVIIHVPYKVHTIHHTILKHIHHHDKGGEDKYEVLGYTIGKPIDPLQHHQHQFEPANNLHHKIHLPMPSRPNLPPPPPSVPHLHSHPQPATDPYNDYHQHHSDLIEHEFSGSNELGHGNDWVPSHGHNWAPSYEPSEFAEGGDVSHGNFHGHVEHVPSHEFHGHKGFAGYD